MLNVSPVHRPYETLPGLNDPSIPALAPLPTGETEDVRKIIERFGEDILAAGTFLGQQVVYVDAGRLVDLARFVKSEPDLAYEALVDVTAVDRLKLPFPKEGERSERFQTIYQLRSYRRKQHLMIVCPAPGGDDPAVPTLTTVYEGANWPEREAADLLGVRFIGHPDPRRILMPENWPYHPLRKEIPEGGEEVPFSLTFDDPQFETLGKQILPAESVAPPLPPGMNAEHMILNFGPHHPSTHGVLRLVVELDGETVINLDPDLGYLHSGFEKTGENKRYKDFVYYTDRMDYLSAMSNNFGYVLAVEKLLGLEIPERAQVIRVIMAELQRLASHLFWLATHSLDLAGAGLSTMMYATRERERILDLFEMVCGARLTTSYIRIGGVWRDLPAAFLSNLEDFVRIMPAKIDDYERMLGTGPLWRERLENIGVISRETAIDMGLTGPMLRGSGVDWDLRRDAPYGGYENYDFKVPVFTEGDCYARYLVRMEEMRQSLRIIRQCLEHMPAGDYKARHPLTTPPIKDRTMRDIETLITHFLNVSWGPAIPPGEACLAIEATKGINSYYLVSDGETMSYRTRIRTPSFPHLQMIPAISRGALVADLIAIIGSIDFVMADVDR